MSRYGSTGSIRDDDDSSHHHEDSPTPRGSSIRRSGSSTASLRHSLRPNLSTGDLRRNGSGIISGGGGGNSSSHARGGGSNTTGVDPLRPLVTSVVKPPPPLLSSWLSSSFQEPRSCWVTEGATPMISRPHYEDKAAVAVEQQQQPRPIPRVRSRSWGGAAIRKGSNNHDDDYSRVLGDWKNLWLPRNTETKRIATPQFGRRPTMYDTETTRLLTRPEQPVVIPGGAAVEQAPPPPDEEKSSAHTPAVGSFLPTPSPVNEQSSSLMKGEEEAQPVWISLLYGVINATIVLPVVMSFAAIIYRHQLFAPYMPILVKLTMISSIVHQLCFSTLSSLPFAVGAVQDAGLIFLSSMATDLVQYCQERGHDNETILATVMVSLSLGTALLGLALVCVGKLRLAQYVQMLPTSVVGGYLAYIGFFCGLAGVGLMAASSTVDVVVIVNNWQFILPGVLGGILIYGLARKLRHMAVVPTCILGFISLFYLVLWLRGSSVQNATDKGWIRQMDPPPEWSRTWQYMRLDKVVWRAIPRLLLTEISMIFVVALSSSLDVAAIELELQRPLNYNSELQTVGWSNFVSGLTGGYTGSYIFSQSIFSLRAGVRSRLAGFVLAGAQTVVFFLPFPILSYVPNFFFGSLLTMICVDLMYEWLIDVRQKVQPVEYLICLSTFGLILFTGVEYGILLGVGLYTVCAKIGLDVGEPKTVIVASTANEESVKSGSPLDDEIHKVVINPVVAPMALSHDSEDDPTHGALTF